MSDKLYRSGSKSKRFREFYKNAKIISREIKYMNYSPAKERELVKRLYKIGGTQEKYKEDVYRRFNIRQYKNMEELRRDMIDYGYTTEQIAKIEADYKHRDLLIGSGQYQEYRIRSYQTRYLKALRIANVSEEFIENIRKLSTAEFGILSGKLDYRTNTNAKYLLPQLGGFNYYMMGVHANDKTKEIEDKIEFAFNEAGIKFDKNIITNPIKFQPKETVYTLRSTLGRLFPSKQEYLNSAETEQEYKRRAFKLIVESIDNGSKIFQTNSNGIKYLRFIGKDIPTSKNFTFVHDFIKYYNNRNK